MGFISSILCCSSDSSQATSKWNNKEVNSRSQQLQGREQVNNRSSYSPRSAGTNLNLNHSSRLNSDTATSSSENSGHHINAEETGKRPRDNNSEPVSQQSLKNRSHNQELRGMDVCTRQRAGGTYNNDLADRLPWDSTLTSEKSDRQGKLGIRSKNEITEKEKETDIQIEEKENEKDNELQSNDADSEEAEGEKRGVYVYTGDTDTSTGGSSYDHQFQAPQSTPNTAARNQLPPSPDLRETTTIVNGGENANGSDDTDGGFQHDKTNDAEINGDMDVDAVPPYEEEEEEGEGEGEAVGEEEFVDLTELQPSQYHALGCSTLLPPQPEHFSGKKCLVLDLDETLVHSSFKYLKGADFVLPVDIDDQIHNVYVMKRPGVDEFLQKVGTLFEVVVFTASVARYGDPLLDILDKNNCIHHRLFREACYNYEGNYIKNLSQIGRPLSEIIILDNSPASYIFHPQHAIPISSWFSDTHDNELLDIIPLLEDLSEQCVSDVGKVLDITI